ncbi:OadG family protein [Hydrogenoanaerobacterium sp.]|uniref:OadG family protein n=1 Tax=Hydrogenoanaerobacterium sp. TaxID=2953763 RepID=UPI00289CC6EE|nr:OadG family protein [Hydrogenoanaerobacterium sp.]
MDYTLAGTVVLSGMSIVFVVLILLTLIVMAFGKIMDSTANSPKNNNKQAPPAVKEAAPTPAPKAAPMQIVEDGISDEVVAVISASIAAMMGESKSFVIKSVKRAKDARPVWSMAGMQQNTNPF